MHRIGIVTILPAIFLGCSAPKEEPQDDPEDPDPIEIESCAEDDEFLVEDIADSSCEAAPLFSIVGASISTDGSLSGRFTGCVQDACLWECDSPENVDEAKAYVHALLSDFLRDNVEVWGVECDVDVTNPCGPLIPDVLAVILDPGVEGYDTGWDFSCCYTFDVEAECSSDWSWR
jgi:hypothetical protein